MKNSAVTVAKHARGVTNFNFETPTVPDFWPDLHPQIWTGSDLRQNYSIMVRYVGVVKMEIYHYYSFICAAEKHKKSNEKALRVQTSADDFHVLSSAVYRDCNSNTESFNTFRNADHDPDPGLW